MLAVNSQNKLKKTAGIQSEISLLICCAKSNIGAKDREKIKVFLQDNIDWKYLLETGKKHKILPLLYANLVAVGSDSLEKDRLEQFKTILKSNITKNFLLTAELLEILDYLQKNKIEAIPVKGVVLANLAYSNYGLRSISDLDIIVREKDFIKTQELLIAHEYKASSINKEAYYQQAQYYKKKNIVIGIDLHYEFAPKKHFATVDSSLFWANVELFKIGSQEIKVFAIEYTLIHLCLEGIKEHWRSLNRLCDVSELICNQEINWKLLLANAEALNKKEVVFLGLYLAHTILNTPIPNDILQEINYSLTRKISQEKIHKFLFRTEFSLFKSVKWYLFLSQAFVSPATKMQYLYQVFQEKLKSKK
jgi:hypothetical protein